jgi:toxin FitB
VTGWLLDTNVISELRRPRPEPKVVAYVADKPLDLLFIGSVTLAEIRTPSNSSPTRGSELS